MSDWLDAEAHADRALEWFERGRLAEAEAELRKAIGLNPDQPDWHFNLGMTLEAAGRDAEALASYERSIELMPDQPEPLVAAGIVCNRLGRFEEAIERLRQAMRLDRTSEAAYAHLMDSHLRLGEHQEVETTFYLAQQALVEPSAHCLSVLAESLVQGRRLAQAEWCLKEALRRDPTIPRLRARLGAVMAATGRQQRALHMYLRDLRSDPGNIDTLLDYGDLLTELGRFPDAAEKFRRVLELEPANVDAHHRLGRVAVLSRQHELAHIEFELVLKLDPDFPGIRLDLAETLLRRGWVRDARHHLRDELDRLAGAADADPPRNAGWEPAGQTGRLGQLLLEAGLPQEAARCLASAIEEDGPSADRFRELALARFRSGDRAGGVAASRRALRLDRGCMRSIHNLALAALEEKRIRLAAGWIRRGLAVDRHDVGIRRLRMRLYGARIARLLWGPG
jgi:tetratricopeptide (TPR) repeat protein